MTFSRLTQVQMLDWLRETIDADQPLPTDAMICERFTLSGPERARALLADLAERREITIKGYGDSRVITLGRAAPELPNERPAPPVAKRDAQVERVAAKIVAIRGTPPAEVAKLVAAERPASGFIGTDAELTGLIGTLVAELASRAGQSSEVANLRRELDEMTARAEAAEAKLAQARQALAA